MESAENLIDHWLIPVYNLSQPLCMMAEFGYQYFERSSKPLLDLYDYALGLGDPRVEEWPLMGSPWPTIGITLLYLYMCLCGPQHFMANRKPLEVKSLILAYNFFISGLNLYIGLELLMVSRELNFSWTCQPVDYSDDPTALRIAAALWWYYFSKFLEMLDSFFFIARKRERQLTFLHIYHHSTMFCLWWIGVKYVAGGSSFLGAMFNCFVHVLMYGYYFGAALGPKYRRFLWWKKYLTLIQMAQFVFALIMGINAIIIGCSFPMWMQYAMVLYMMSFLVLFSKFFYKEYIAKSKKSGTVS
nr:elongation of very long chain fatty acids protein 4 [Apocyclops royi]